MCCEKGVLTYGINELSMMNLKVKNLKISHTKKYTIHLHNCTIIPILYHLGIEVIITDYFMQGSFICLTLYAVIKKSMPITIGYFSFG